MGNDKENSLISEDGSPLSLDAPETDRASARNQEDEKYVPVIIKRQDHCKVHPDDVLENVIEEGLEQLGRRSSSLLLSSIAAGLILGFSVMAVAVVMTATSSFDNLVLQRLLMAFIYPLGFIVCIVSGTQLFTEHTATAVYPFLDRKCSLLSLGRLWFLVTVGNLVGTFASALMLVAVEPVVGGRAGYLKLAYHLVEYKFSTLLMSALLAGWLMAQGAWLIQSARSLTSQMLCIYIATFLIGVGGFHHSIAGSAEIFIATLLSDRFLFTDCLYFIPTALFGNLIGGSIFVAILNYTQIKKTQLNT